MTQEEYEEENKRQCLNYLEEIDRLTAQLAKRDAVPAGRNNNGQRT